MPEHWIFDRAPIVLPLSWRIVEQRLDGMKYVQAITGVTIIVSGGVEQDGRRWIHLSLAHPSRIPTWSELVAAKEIFIGRDAHAVQVIPPRAQHVNLHPYCLHLFSCVDGHPLPDFTRGTASL
jgi:hypothetical protein